jgi:hypothetical protein
MKKDILGRSMVLESLRSAFEKSYASGDVLDSKLQNLLNFCSVIVSIVASVEASAFQSKVGVIFWILFLVTLILYFITFSVVIQALNPTIYLFPISNNWEELSRRYFHSDEKELLELMISEYLDSMKKTREANVPKVKAVKRASLLMTTIVMLLLIAVPIGLIFPSPTLAESFQQITNFIVRIKP